MAVLDLTGLTYFQSKKYNPVSKDVSMTRPVGRDSNGKLWAAGNAGVELFGVAGVGGSSPTLTRLWDAAGLTATPGTDTGQGSSDFDAYDVFNRKKCVGSWSVSDGKAVFTPQAYYGDADYAEDGSKGDYVCVDVPPTYWYHDEDNGILGVSGSAASGWEPHPVCCREDGTVRDHTYLPCYALAKDGNGYAVSLPGFHNFFGHYQGNWAAAKTYGDGSSFANYAIIEPSAVDHYEWLMMTIEFATQNMQSIIAGATSMRYASDAITLAPEANKIVVTSAIGANFVVGQSIYIGATYSTTPSDVSAYNIITAIEACDADGTLNESGAYKLITYSGTDRTSSITAGTTTVSSRPWITGATQGYAPGVSAVLGHTGSPVSNSSGKYPMLYRWRENTYGNQNMTCLDLMNVRVEVDTDTYKLQWYHNPYLQHEGASKYYPSSSSKPDTTDLTTTANGWELLGTETPKESYVNGYIKEEGFDDDYPHVRVPTLTTGGSATTFYCDYATLVSSHVVRAVRRRGSLYSGAYSGPRFVSAAHAPSLAYWIYGSGLYFTQQG